MYKNKKNLIISIGATVFMFVAIISYLWIIVYTLNFKSKIETLENKNQAEISLSDTSHKQKMFLRSIEDEIKEIDTYILDIEDVASLLREIETFGAYTGTIVSIQNITVRDIGVAEVSSKKSKHQKKSISDDVLSNIVITVTTSGDADGVYKLLSLFETLPLYSDIEKVSFVRDGDGNLWNASLRISVLQKNNSK